MPSTGFETAIPKINLIQDHASDRTFTGIGYYYRPLFTFVIVISINYYTENDNQ